MKLIIELVKDPQFIVVPLLLLAVAWVFWPGRTDTTDKSYWKRSGMRLHTDYETGVQYLSGPHGGLHPRLTEEGKPFIVKGHNNGR